MWSSSIWTIDRTLSGITPSGRNRSGSVGDKEVLWIPQSSSITGSLPSDGLMSYSGYSLRRDITLFRDAVGVFLTGPEEGLA